MRRPNASTARHCSSLYGFVTRGDSTMRCTLIACSNFVSRFLERARDRRGADGMRRARERDVAFAGEQARGRIEADPAGAGQIDLGPRVQVREVALGARRAVERLHVGDELDQVARHEAARQTQVPQDVDEQPARVAARAGAQLQRLLGRPARPAPCGSCSRCRVAGVGSSSTRKSMVRVGGLRAHRFRASAARAARPARRRGTARDPCARPARRRTETVSASGSRKKSNGLRTAMSATRSTSTKNRLDLVGKDDAREEVAVRILLPVQEVAVGLDAQRVAQARACGCAAPAAGE